MQVHPESRNWFVHVGRGGTRFVAELGYYAKADGRWTGVSISAPTLTPPDSLSADTSVQLASIPIDVPFERLLELMKIALNENVPLADAILQLRASSQPGPQKSKQIRGARWTPAQERALAELLSMDSLRRVRMGLSEITESIRSQLTGEFSSLAPAQFSLAVAERVEGSVSSPFGGAPRGKEFWFNVNAELVIYGATEPDAKVTIGGRDIKLRADGSFSYRFALPDGHYELTVMAVSVDQSDARTAELKFSRDTEYTGEVGVRLQDEKLKLPQVESVG